MIEETILNYLNYHLSAPVYINAPKNKPEEYFLLEKTGGSLPNKINKATIVLQAYGKSYYRASELINEANTAMLEGLVTLDSISEVEINSSYNFTDTTRKEPRYQSVYVVTHY